MAELEFKRLEATATILGERRMVRWDGPRHEGDAGGHMSIDNVDHFRFMQILDMLGGTVPQTAAVPHGIPPYDEAMEAAASLSVRAAAAERLTNLQAALKDKSVGMASVTVTYEAKDEGARIAKDESGAEANTKPPQHTVQVHGGDSKPFAELTMADMKKGVTSNAATRQREPGDDDGDEPEEKKPQAVGADGVPENVRKAGRMLDIVNWCMERGIKDAPGIVAECEKLRATVPFLGRVSDMENRVTRTLQAFHAAT